MDPTDNIALGIGDLQQRPRVFLRRGMIDRCRGLLSQGLMWPIVVVVLSKLIKSPLLEAQGPRRRGGGFLFQRAMKPFMAAVLGGLGRFNALGDNAELDPPNRQPGQAPHCRGGEGRSVVGPDRPG